MDKEMKPSLQQMMARLLEEIKADINAKMQAGQEEIKAFEEKADAEAKACQDQLKQNINGHMEATVNSIRSDLE
jgi:Skp family chaperone for outer membrane proteins